jgi:hypothetical protein
MVKLLGMLALVALVGAALIGGGAWYWWSRYGGEYIDAGKQAIEEGRESGRKLDESGCLKAAIERHKAEASYSMSAAIRNDLWLTACLDASQAQLKFCEGIPSDDDVLAASLWATSTCLNLGLSDSHCGNLVGKAVKYCSSPERAAKLRSVPGSMPSTRS